MRETDAVEEVHPAAAERQRKTKLNMIAGFVGLGMSIAAFVNGLMVDNTMMQIAAFVGAAFSGERLSWSEIKSLIPGQNK